MMIFCSVEHWGCCYNTLAVTLLARACIRLLVRVIASFRSNVVIFRLIDTTARPPTPNHAWINIEACSPLLFQRIASSIQGVLFVPHFPPNNHNNIFFFNADFVSKQQINTLQIINNEWIVPFMPCAI